mmetsp:Transcript_1255/g.3911  ORF Transcript_1255/g.3911 Transcript_1255/m.3911 type:complete len:245 (+) Transcript_1255:884-1618(+)
MRGVQGQVLWRRGGLPSAIRKLPAATCVATPALVASEARCVWSGPHGHKVVGQHLTERSPSQRRPAAASRPRLLAARTRAAGGALPAPGIFAKASEGWRQGPLASQLPTLGYKTQVGVRWGVRSDRRACVLVGAGPASCASCWATGDSNVAVGGVLRLRHACRQRRAAIVVAAHRSAGRLPGHAHLLTRRGAGGLEARGRGARLTTTASMATAPDATAAITAGGIAPSTGRAAAARVPDWAPCA